MNISVPSQQPLAFPLSCCQHQLAQLAPGICERPRATSPGREMEILVKESKAGQQRGEGRTTEAGGCEASPTKT